MRYGAVIEAMVFNPREFRNALGRFTTGVTVITTVGPGGKPEGMTANSFSGLSLEPPLVQWCIGKSTPTYNIFCDCEYFTINILRAEQRHISNQFATPAADKFIGIDWQSGLGGCPIVGDPLAVFECTNWSQNDGGDHTILIGEVIKFTYQDGEPLLFNAGKYAHIASCPDDGMAKLDTNKFADLLL